MIEKERLEELIKQGAIIYKLTHNNRIDCRRLRSKMKIVDNSLYFNYKDPHLYSNLKWCYSALYRLFENKEDAEWHKEFGCIERTERLELPTWEEFYDRDKPIRFKRGSYDFYCCKIGSQIAIKVYYQGKEIGIKFMKPLIQENYTLACRKAKELFLGEKE